MRRARNGVGCLRGLRFNRFAPYRCLQDPDEGPRHRHRDRKAAQAALKQAADKLLANTLIENYQVEVK